MGEFVPLVLGVIVGVGIGVRHRRPRAVDVTLASAVIGVVAAWVNGELTDAPWLVVFDTAQAAVAIALTVALLRVVRPVPGTRKG